MMAHVLPRSPAPHHPAAIVARGIDVVRSSVSRLVRRGDAHPDAPACRPIRARDDLGMPLPTVGEAGAWMSPPPERPLPRDLNLPLSAFDPGAIRTAPRGFADPMQLERTLDRFRLAAGV